MYTDRYSLAGRSFNRITSIYPRAGAACDVDQIRETLLLQQTRGRARTITSRANHCRGFVFLEGEFIDSSVECRQRRIHRSRHVTVAVLRWTPHVDDLQLAVGDLFFQLGHADLLDRIDWKTCFAPTVNAGA